MSGGSRRGGNRAVALTGRAVPWLVAAVVSLLVAVGIRLFVVETFVIPSSSMEPLLLPGDRVVVGKLGEPRVDRGQVVVFDGSTTFGAASSDGGSQAPLESVTDLLSGRVGSTEYVKRVIGVGGDRVTCCSAKGQVTVNGSPLPEPYLYPGDEPSQAPFEVVVPPGRVWLMGDHRSNSKDSRAHLGDPGGGTVAVADIVGPVSFRFWPLDRFGALSPEFTGDAQTARLWDGSTTGQAECCSR